MEHKNILLSRLVLKRCEVQEFISKYRACFVVFGNENIFKVEDIYSPVVDGTFVNLLKFVGFQQNC